MAEERINELKKRVEVQRKALGSLAESLEGEDSLKDLMERVEKPCEALRFLAAAGGGADEGFVLSWSETRHLFLQYLEFKRYEPANARNMLNYLDRFVKEPMKKPLDVMRVFSPLTVISFVFLFRDGFAASSAFPIVLFLPRFTSHLQTSCQILQSFDRPSIPSTSHHSFHIRLYQFLDHKQNNNISVLFLPLCFSRFYVSSYYSHNQLVINSKSETMFLKYFEFEINSSS